METHIIAITRVIQLAVAPVFLLTAIGTLIGALNIRLGRAVDRRRIVQQLLETGPAGEDLRAELSTDVDPLGARAHGPHFAAVPLTRAPRGDKVSASVSAPPA